MEVRVEGDLGSGISAKDLILHIIGQIGAAGGSGYVIEYRGAVFERMTVEERLTVCNMSIEAGARAGLIAPDEVTFDYLRGRPRAPQGKDWERATADWRSLHTDPGARFDAVRTIDASRVEPMITYGTNPGMVAPISGRVPDRPGDAAFAKSLAYMGLSPGQALRDQPVQVVFVGSCTNARLSDLEAAARVLDGRRVASGVRMLVVPGSQQIKLEAERRGLAKLFVDAGAEWREAGCSMCLGMNGDTVDAGQFCISTSNRNFEGRQGVGARTLLASPAAAAAAAIRGRVSDPREFMH
jgi:3-isopropylmalate/(R)-2-methylmalate dehydratase large subunit